MTPIGKKWRMILGSNLKLTINVEVNVKNKIYVRRNMARDKSNNLISLERRIFLR